MTDQDRELVELVADKAANRAVDRAEERMLKAIEEHHKQCLIAQENKNLKMGFKVLGAIAAGGAAAGAAGSKLGAFISGAFK